MLWLYFLKSISPEKQQTTRLSDPQISSFSKSRQVRPYACCTGEGSPPPSLQCRASARRGLREGSRASWEGHESLSDQSTPLPTVDLRLQGRRCWRRWVSMIPWSRLPGLSSTPVARPPPSLSATSELPHPPSLLPDTPTPMPAVNSLEAAPPRSDAARGGWPVWRNEECTNSGWGACLQCKRVRFYHNDT